MGIYFFNKTLFNYRYYYFLFSHSDRFIGKQFLMNLFDYLFQNKVYRWTGYEQSLTLMSSYSTISLGIYYSALAQLREKFSSLDRLNIPTEASNLFYLKTMSHFAELYILNLEEIIKSDLSDFLNVSMNKLKSRFTTHV
jgi:hypothetical protein